MGKQISQSRPSAAMIDQEERSGSVKGLLLLALFLVGVAASLVFFKGQFGGQLQLIFLSILAGVGILALLGLAVGLLRFGGAQAAPHLTRQFVDSMTDGVLVCDAKDRIVYANAEYARLTGAEGADGIRSIERSFAGEPDAAEAIYRLSEAVRDGRPAMEEFRLFKNPASSEGGDVSPQARWYRIRVRALNDMESGGSKQALAVWKVTDITRDRERQENIFQELQLAINYLDHAPAGFFSSEPDGRIVYMNATLADWLGYDLTQFEPRHLNLNELVSGDGTALLDAASAAPGMPKTEMLDIDLVKRNGHSLPVRLMHRVPMASDGTPGASRTLVLNRSPGEDISEELRVAEVRFARFFNNTPIAIAAMTSEGKVVRTNAPFAKLFASVVPGERPGERLGEDGEDQTPTIHSLVVEKNRAELSERMEEALSGKSHILPVECDLAEDHSRTVRFFLSGVEDSEADDEKVIVYALETTEQRALEVQFTQSQKMQAVGQLAGGVAHDFNNVLTAIIGFSDLLLASHRPSDPSFQDIMNIKQNANRAASLVRQLLAFSRRQTLRPQVLELGDVLADLSILLDRLLGEKVDLDMVHGRDLWPVKADLNQLEQVIVNLAVNARDAMPDGGQLTIQTRNLGEAEAAEMPYSQLEPADYVLLEVLDSGTGIPPDIRDKIFEPFFSTKDVGKGTGLGLSTVYGIVKQTGGFIFLESEMGQGTTFRIFLPRHVEEAKALTGASEQGAMEGTNGADEDTGLVDAPSADATAITDLTGSATILLVEDEEAVRAFAARALASRGYSVHEAGSGAEALELIEEIEEKVDLVVSDVVMPEMDGPTMLGELRKKRPELKVIFMSGYAEEAFRKNLPDNVEFGFLPKPFSLKQLATKIREVLDS